MKKSSNKGFTLVELIIVIAIKTKFKERQNGNGD